MTFFFTIRAYFSFMLLLNFFYIYKTDTVAFNHLLRFYAHLLGVIRPQIFANAKHPLSYAHILRRLCLCNQTDTYERYFKHINYYILWKNKDYHQNFDKY